MLEAVQNTAITSLILDGGGAFLSYASLDSARVLLQLKRLVVRATARLILDDSFWMILNYLANNATKLQYLRVVSAYDGPRNDLGEITARGELGRVLRRVLANSPELSELVVDAPDSFVDCYSLVVAAAPQLSRITVRHFTAGEELASAVAGTRLRTLGLIPTPRYEKENAADEHNLRKILGGVGVGIERAERGV